MQKFQPEYTFVYFMMPPPLSGAPPGAKKVKKYAFCYVQKAGFML